MPYRLKPRQPTQLQHKLQQLMVSQDIQSGSDLARQLNIPPPSINRILSGQVIDPRISTLILIADHFDIGIDELLGRKK